MRKWSQFIHSAECLYLSRMVRFRDELKSRYMEMFSIQKPRARILEIGCASGALCHQLARWYPTAKVVGIDVDEDFIRYARMHNKNAIFECVDFMKINEFIETYGKFDYVVIHSMLEFFDSATLLNAIWSALEDKGIAITINNRIAMSLKSSFWEPESVPCHDDNDSVSDIYVKHPMSDSELICTIQCNRFNIMSVDYLAVPVIIDNSKKGSSLRKIEMQMYREYQTNRLTMICRRQNVVEHARIKNYLKRNDCALVSKIANHEAYGEGRLDVDVLQFIRAIKRSCPVRGITKPSSAYNELPIKEKLCKKS